MVRLNRCAIILALSLGCAELCFAANSQASLQNKTIKKPTGSVSGRITVKGKGKGGVAVTVRTGDPGRQTEPLQKAVTDADGNYLISDLSAGNYQVTPVAPAFIVQDFSSQGRPGKSVILAEGENVDEIDFSMVRGGVITGRISHADGRPVIEERVNVMIEQPGDRPGRDPLQGPGGQTDDQGIYRVFGLAPGRYKAFVGQSPDTVGGGGGQPGRPVYPRIYYPDVANLNEARVIELGEGSEATNIDITVGESRKGFAASGVVIDTETNQPLPNVRFGLQKKVIGDRVPGYLGVTVLSNRLGVFRFENLAPGRYSIISMPKPNSDQRVDPINFEITDQDKTGLTVRASKGASVSGTIFLEGTSDKNVLSKIAKLLVQAYVPTEGTGAAFVQPSTVGPDGSFRVGGLQQGIVHFHLGALDRAMLTGFVISRVERDGVVFQRGIEIKSGEQLFGVRIVVVYGSGIVRGTIKIENGPLPTGARVMARLVKPETPGIMVGRSQEADARGRFALEGVPAGSYDLMVSVYDPGSRSRPASTKQPVTVTDGAVVEVDPVIELEPNQPPRP